jgi:hypothetical protein
MQLGTLFYLVPKFKTRVAWSLLDRQAVTLWCEVKRVYAHNLPAPPWKLSTLLNFGLQVKISSTRCGKYSKHKLRHLDQLHKHLMLKLNSYANALMLYRTSLSLWRSWDRASLMYSFKYRVSHSLPDPAVLW